MADDILESNIVIKTKVARPNREGIISLRKDFDDIEKRLTALTSRPWIIKLQVDDSDLKRYNLNRPVVSSGNSGNTGSRPPVPSSGPLGRIPGVGGGDIYSRKRTYGDENVIDQEQRRRVAGNLLLTETKITDEQGEKNKLIQEELNLQQKVLQVDAQRRTEASLRLRDQQLQAKLAREGRELAASVRQDIKAGQFPLTIGQGTAGGFTTERIIASAREEVALRKVFAKEKIEAERYVANELKRIDAERADEATKALTRQFRQDRREAEAYVKEQTSLRKKLAADAVEADRYLASEARKLVAQQKRDATEAANYVASESRKRKRQEERDNQQYAAAARRQDRREAGSYFREFQSNARRGGIDAAVQQGISQGFEERPAVERLNVLNGTLERTRQLVRTTGNAFAGYRVEVISANEATGVMTSKVLEGSAAMRFLGDNMVRAVAKVLLWTLATAAIFGSIGAIVKASEAIKDLEENTVLLARVGSGLSRKDAGFEERLEQAEKLTNSILDLTRAYGGSAVEAQKAATIFARTGQSRQEVLESVKATLLASRIAELDTVEAANLLSAAYLQFDLRSRDLLPTLDSLNSLSNNYRVTTNDLLQAISRTGAVFSDHHGRLSELAAITAVVSQETARSGAEIGNAFKTISSNLDRLDIQAGLLDKLGISTVNFAGESKSLGQVLLEIQTRMDRLNTTDQRQLTLQIAGVRQRNILLAAIKQSADAVVAENEALLQSGSAQQEFTQRSQTLRSALERLYATLTEIAKLGGEGLASFARQFLNVITYLLRFLSAFNGLPLKIAVATAGFLLLARGIQAVGTQLIVLTATLRAATTQLLSFSGAAAVAQTAMSAINPIALAATVVLVGLTLAFGDLAGAQNAYAESVQTGSDAVEQNIITEQKRRDAIVNSTRALLQLVSEYDRLKRSSKDTDRNSAEAIKARGLQIAGSIGFSGVSSGNFTSGQILKESRDAQTRSIREEKKQIQDLLVLKQKEIELEEKRIQLILRDSQVSRQGSYFKTGLFSYSLSASEIAKSESAIRKTRQERAELTAQANELRRVEQFDQISKQPLFDALNNKLAADRLRIQDREIEERGRGFSTAVDPESSARTLEASYKSIVKDSDEAELNLNRMLDLTEKIGTAQYQEDIKRVNKLFEERLDIYQKLVQLTTANARESVGGLFGSRNSLLDRGGQIGLSLSRGLSNASPYGDDIARIELDRQRQLDRIATASRVGASVGGNGAADIGAAQASRQETQAAITRLKELEADRAIAILEAEKNIAIERKKSADEAARALGTLSDEDKLRVRAQAAYLSKTPGKIGLETQFATDAKSNQLLQQFFGGRLESLSDTKSALAGTLSRAGFGSTEAIAKGEAELAAARGGRKDSDILNDALQSILRLEEQLLASQGKPVAGLAGFGNAAFGLGVGQGLNAAGGINQGISVTARAEQLDLGPIITAFEEATTGLYQEAINKAAQEFQLVLKRERALNARNKPQTAIPPE